jgi:hypothetical protein
MATATQPAPTLASAAPVSPAIFSYRALKGERQVMSLVAYALEGQQVRVDAQIASMQAQRGREPQSLSYTFPSREQAQRFADDAVISFEYMGCQLEVLT